MLKSEQASKKKFGKCIAALLETHTLWDHLQKEKGREKGTEKAEKKKRGKGRRERFGVEKAAESRILTRRKGCSACSTWICIDLKTRSAKLESDHSK